MSFNNRYTQLFYSFIVGIIAGLLGGLLGITGTVIVIPLAIVFGLFENYKTAIGTILFTYDPILSIFAVLEYAKKNYIDYLIAATLFVSYVIGSYIGSKYNNYFPVKTLKYITAFILFILSLYVFYNAYHL